MTSRHWQEANSSLKNKNEAYYYNSKLKYEQMSKQQQLIEEKKLEIQKRLEEKKKKETEEALKKLNDGKQKSDLKLKRSFHTPFSKNKNLPGRDRVSENVPGSSTNIFSNDGSFFQQFQKISGIKVEIKKKSSSRSKASSENSKAESKAEAENIQSGSVQPETKAVQPVADVLQQIRPVPEPQQQQPIPQQQQPMLQHHQPMPQHQQPMPQLQQPMLQLQQPMPQHQMMPHMMSNHPHGPPIHQQMFNPHPMPMPPVNFQHRYNPMPHGMMLPPPMAPSSIPPPAPLNPGSIPSPSPLQPCSIPSPSPLQPYAIPPPSPLLPHSIPPPSPMIPHSIPPPNPLTPHSIPPPLPLRPQSIPPPMHPPMFLSMVPPPPPPPPEEENQEVEKLKSPSPPPPKQINEKEVNIEDDVKHILKNDDYSSSSDEEEKDQVFGPSNRQQDSSDTESESDKKYQDSNSDKESDAESDAESDKKVDYNSDTDSEMGQESQPILDSSNDNSSTYQPIGDTQTQFPCIKDTSSSEDTAPPDICESEGDSQRQATDVLPSSPSIPSSQDHIKQEAEYDQIKQETEYDQIKQEPDYDQMKREPEYKCDENVGVNETPADMSTTQLEVKQEPKTEIKEEKVKYLNFIQGKTETIGETSVEDQAVKFEEQPPPKKKRKSRWATNDDVPLPPVATATNLVQPQPPGVGVLPPLPPPAVGPVGIVAPLLLGGVNIPLPPTVPTVNIPGMSGPMISKVGRSDPALIAYAMKSYGHTNMTDAEWKKVEDHYKINLLYQDMMKKREELERLQAAGKHKYEYDSDEETEGGTWEHRLRSAEMEATQLWADELTEQAKGKHHIGDFLPPDELAKFMEKYEALKDGREPDLSDYKEFKLKEDNVGFQMLQKLGWTEGQGLGPDGSGIMDPVNKATIRLENQGLGMERPEDVEADDDEYDAYRKRMMLAYRFRPNPMNNPRRPYY